jgi:hypothetical protein
MIRRSVEVLSDDRSHGIIVAAFDRFQLALNACDKLLRGRPVGEPRIFEPSY